MNKKCNNRMIKRIFAGLLIAVVLCSSVPMVEGLGVTKAAKQSDWDGSFESGVIGEAPMGWSLASSNIRGEYDKKNDYTGYYQLLVSEERYKGEKALEISPSDKGTKGYVYAETDLLSVESATAYSFNYAVKITGAEKPEIQKDGKEKKLFFGVSVYLTQYDKKGKELKRTQLGVTITEDVDWEGATMYVQTEADTAEVRLSYWVGGEWQRNQNLKILVDEIEIEKIPDKQLLNGDFEKGSGKYDIYSWHLTSKTIQNEDIPLKDRERLNYVANYTMSRETDGYHGDAVSVTRNSYGYVTLDSNRIKIQDGATYIIDAAMRIRIQNEADNFEGVGLYLSEYDKKGEKLSTVALVARNKGEIDWTEVTASYTPNKDATHFQLEFWCGGLEKCHFTASFDDVRITTIQRKTSTDGINNGNFEELYDGAVFDWEFVKRPESSVTSTFDGYNGTKGIYIERTSKEEQSYACIKSNFFTVVGGQNYKYTYMSRFEEQKGMCYIVVNVCFYDQNGEYLEFIRDQEHDHRTETTEWENEAGYVTAPKGAAQARLEVLIAGISYKCWMDDFTWHTRDKEADVYGFDAIDQRGNLTGWTVSQPAAAKIDKKTFREGTASLFLSGTLHSGYTEIIADETIPLNSGVRYKYTMYVKSYDCDVDMEGIKLLAVGYNKEGKAFTYFEGTRLLLNEDSEESGWMELTLGVNNTAGNVAYIRPYIQIDAGSMNVWLDDFSWKVWDVTDEFYEDFDSIRDDGTPDGWTAAAISGNPTFVTSDSVVRIEAPTDSDTGMITTKWKTIQQYISCDFTTTYSTTAGTKAKVVIKFYDYNGTEIEKSRQEKILDATNGEYADSTFQFIMPAMTYAMIELSNEGAGMVAFEGLKIVQNTVETASAETDWRGAWIWYDEDYHDSINGTPRYFRYTFTLPDNPLEGNLQITADDYLRLWINGVEIVDEAFNQTWENISLIEDIQKYLTAGENVIAVSVGNYTLYSGLLFDGYVTTENDEWVDIISSDTTVSNLTEYEGWQEKDFDDSSWPQAKVVEKVGGNQWGSDAIFDASAIVQNVFEVQEYSITDNVVAGNAVKLTMTVIPEKDIKGSLDLKAKLWIRNTEKSVMTTALEQLSGPDISEWKAGKKVTVSYSFEIPDYIGSGKYALQLDTNQVKITNPEILDNKFTQAIRLENDAENQKTETELVNCNGTYAFSINGKVEPITMYTTTAKATYNPTASAGYMCEAGVCITRVWMTPGEEGIWIGEDKYDFDMVDDLIYDVLADHQDSYIMLTLGITAPNWWVEANPDEVTLTGQGVSTGESIGSDKLVEDTKKCTLAMIEHMKEQPYYNRIIGATLGGYTTWEWIWYGEGQTTFDYCEANQKKWKEWVAKKYATDAQLQEAWNDTSKTLDAVRVPEPELFVGNTYSTVLDPATQQEMIDYKTYLGEINAQRLIDFAAVVTEAVDDTWVLGAYNGYMIGHYAYHTSMKAIHTATSMVLEDENLDFFCAPLGYNQRYDGESAGYMWMTDGCLAAGKALVVEDDLRLCPWTVNGVEFLTRDAVGPTFDMEDSVSQIEREVAKELVDNVGNWYMDLQPGFFSRETFSDVIEIGTNEFVVNLAREKDCTGDVCYIIDEDIYMNLAHDYWASYDTLQWVMKANVNEFSKLGMTVDSYHMSDLEKGRVPDYKVYIMLSPVEIDAKEKAAIEKYLKNGDKVIVWEYLCGASDGETFSAQNMSEMIGIDVTFDTTARNQSAVISDKQHWLTEGQNGRFIGQTKGREVVSPTGIVKDSSAEVLAYMSDCSGDAALAVKDMGEWTSIYSAVPTLPAEILRNILKQYDVHMYSENTNDVIFANNNYVAINATYGGEKEITLDGTYAVYDVFDMTTYSLSTDTITFDMKDNSTKLFRLTPADTHVVYVDLGEGGVSKQAGYQEVSPGKDYTCRVKAKDGYVLSEIIVDGQHTEISAKEYKVAFKDLDNSHYVRVKLQKVSEEVEEAVEDTSVWTTIAWISAALLLMLVVVIIVMLLMKKKKQSIISKKAGHERVEE